MRPGVYEGVISNPDPAELTVLIDAFDEGYGQRQEHGPCGFMPRGHLLPAAGDRCVVVLSEAREPYVVWWDGGTPSAPWLPGELKATVVAAAPGGWALANGAACPPNAELHGVLVAAGYPFGRSGSDPRLPDLCGRVPIGAGRGQAGLTVRTLGAATGSEANTLTEAQLPTNALIGNNPAFGTATGAAWFAPNARGSGQPFSVMQPSLPVYWLVKL